MSVNFSIDNLIDNVFLSFRKTTPALLAIEVTSGFILFGPSEVLNKVYLTGLPNYVLKILGIIFTICTFLLIINIFSFILKRIKNKFSIYTLEKALKELTFMERKMISLMYYAPSHSLLMSFYGQTKGALIIKKIIVQTTNVSSDIGYMTFSYMLQPWVINYIKKHPQFLTMTLEESKKESTEYYQNLYNGEAY